MKKNNGCCPCGCGIKATILGIIFGVVIAIFFALGFIPLILIGIWLALAIGAAVLVYLGLILFFRGPSGDTFGRFCADCFCQYANCLLVGSAGTVLAALVAVSINLVIPIFSTVLIGIAAFFFVFMITSLISYIKCLIKNTCS